jgi:hypothetical protein
MPEETRSYWELIEPLFSTIDTGNGPEAFASSASREPRPAVLLYAAHICLAEVHNGGFLQLFWNCAGVLVPEAVTGFTTIGMPTMSALLTDAMLPLGSPYPRDRDQRWDALLMASGRTGRELKRVFKKAENLYLGFVEATKALPFDSLSEQFWHLAKTENGGFQDAATRYAHSVLNKVQ